MSGVTVVGRGGRGKAEDIFNLRQNLARKVVCYSEEHKPFLNYKHLAISRRRKTKSPDWCIVKLRERSAVVAGSFSWGYRISAHGAEVRVHHSCVRGCARAYVVVAEAVVRQQTGRLKYNNIYMYIFI